MIVSGTMISSWALSVFLLPLYIAPGGISAIALIISEFVPITIGTAVILLNIPLFLFGLRADRTFFIKSLLGTVLLSVFLDLFSKFEPLVSDPIIAAFAGGTLMGLGFGLTFLSGGSTGGTDIAAWLLKKRIPNLKIGRAVLIFDVITIIAEGIVYGQVSICLYALVGMYLNAVMIDIITVKRNKEYEGSGF